MDVALLWRCAKLPDRLDGPDLLQRVVLLLAESAAARVAAAEAAEEAAEEQEEVEEEEAAGGEAAGGDRRPAKVAGDEAAAVEKERAEAAAERRAARRRYTAQAAAGALPGQLLALHLYACQLIEVGLAGALGPQAHAASGGSGSGSDGQGGACGESSEPTGAAAGALRSPGKVAGAATAAAATAGESTTDAASTGSALGTVPAKASVLEQSPPPPLTSMGSLPRASGLGLGFGPDPRLVLPLKRQAASLLSSLKGRAVRLLRGQVAAQQREAHTVTQQGRQAQQQRVAKSKQRTASKALKSERSGECGHAPVPDVLATAAAQEEQEEREEDKAAEEENEKAAAMAMAVPDAAEMVLDAAVRYSRAAAADELLGMYPASVEGYARAADLLLFLLADLPAPPGWRHAPGDQGDGVLGCRQAAGQGAKAVQPQAPLGAGQAGCDGGDGDGLREGVAEGAAAGAAAPAAAPAAAAAVPLMLPERLRPQLSAERRRHAHTVYAAVKLRQAACMQALNAQLSSV